MEMKASQGFKQSVIKKELFTIYVVLYALVLMMWPTVFVFFATRYNLFPIILKTCHFMLIGMIIICCVFLIIFRKKITVDRCIAGGVALLMFFSAAWFCEYYMGFSWGIICHGWHYLGYCLYAILLFRWFAMRRFSTNRIILFVHIVGIITIVIDEISMTALFPLLNTFDISDIARGSWGIMIGFILVFFVFDRGKTIGMKGLSISQNKIKDYLQNPYSLLVLEIIFALLFLVFSSLLSGTGYIFLVFIFTLVAFSAVFCIIHMSRYKTVRIILCGIITLLILIQGFFFLKHRNKNIIFNTFGLIVYKGIPIPVFDVIIYPNGTFRLVDKKHEFNEQDQSTIFKINSDIIIIGSGDYGLGGKGFDFEKKFNEQHGYVFNAETEKMMEVLILKTPEACRVFNKLKKEGVLKVLFILHNTC